MQACPLVCLVQPVEQLCLREAVVFHQKLQLCEYLGKLFQWYLMSMGNIRVSCIDSNCLKCFDQRYYQYVCPTLDLVFYFALLFCFPAAQVNVRRVEGGGRLRSHSHSQH